MSAEDEMDAEEAYNSQDSESSEASLSDTSSDDDQGHQPVEDRPVLVRALIRNT